MISRKNADPSNGNFIVVPVVKCSRQRETIAMLTVKPIRWARPNEGSVYIHSLECNGDWSGAKPTIAMVPSGTARAYANQRR